MSGVLASAMILSMSPVNVLAAEPTNTTEPEGSSTEQTVELKDSFITIKDETMKATYGDSKKSFTYTATMGITPVVTSSDTSVATVEDKNGVVTVTILKAGTSRITVNFEGNEEYKASSDYIDLTVEKATPKLGIAPVDSDIVAGGSVSLKVTGVPEGVEATVECDVAGIVVTKGENGYFTATLPDITKAYKFIVSTTATDNYDANNTYCRVYVTSLEDSFVEEVLLGYEELKAAVIDDVVILDTITADDFEEIFEDDEDGTIVDVLSFDFRNAFEDVETIKLDRTTIRAIDTVLNDKYFDIDSVEFILDSGKMEFDANAWEAIVDNTATTGTTFSLTTHKLKELNNRQQKALDDYTVATTVDFRIVGKTSMDEIDGGITLSIDYDKSKSYDVVSLTTRGVIEDYSVSMNNGYVVFDTDMANIDYVVVVAGSNTSNNNNNNSNNQTNTDTTQGYDKNKVMIMTIDSKVMQLYGNTYVNDVAPIIKNSRTMLPIRIIAENLGASVKWNGDARKVTIEKSGIYIEIYIDSSYAKVNGNVVILDSPAFISNDRTYLPVRFIAENLGANVIWDDYSREVVIIPG